MGHNKLFRPVYDRFVYGMSSSFGFLPYVRVQMFTSGLRRSLTSVAVKI